MIGGTVEIRIRRPEPSHLDADADAAMAVQRLTLQATLPGLLYPHTQQEDRAWMLDNFANCSVWLAAAGSRVIGVATRCGCWIRQLYVAPDHTGVGIGQLLLETMLGEATSEAQVVMQLWTFQRNLGARRFYERNGFEATEFTDGADNEEHEPDVRYRRLMKATRSSI